MTKSLKLLNDSWKKKYDKFWNIAIEGSSSNGSPKFKIFNHLS